MSKINAGDRVVVSSDSKYPKVKSYSESSEAGFVNEGDLGTALGITSYVEGEDRFVRVQFPDKVVYVSERFLKKAQQVDT